jgi:hypothetical protein
MWNSLLQVKYSLLEMECPNFLEGGGFVVVTSLKLGGINQGL